jgi:sulfoxide reductase heme-binding subunit YedZ
MLTYFKKNWLWLLINIIAILPLLGLLGNMGNNLLNQTGTEIEQVSPADDSAEPPSHRERSLLKQVVHVTGEWAIRFLVICLTLTPLYIVFGWRQGLSIKRSTGLWTFGYTLIHFIAFGLDEGWLATFREFNYLMGLIALLIMLPLAVTSHQWWMKQLNQSWKLLHRMAYAAGLFAVLHVAFLGGGSGIMYGSIVGIGLIVRVPQLRKLVTQFRRQFFSRELASA